MTRKGKTMSALHIALYGKGGAGTTTVAANLSVALADAGQKVLQVGFDPDNDSTAVLRADWKVKSLLDAVREGSDAAFEDFMVHGYKGILCLETGLPSPDAACTGHDSRAVVDFIRSRDFLKKHNPDVVIYDLSGEALCSVTAVSLINDIADRVFIVSSADFRSFFAANNLLRAISRQAPSSVRLGGIIANNLTSNFYETILADFAAKTGTRVVGSIPRSLRVMQCSLYNQSVIEAAPHAVIAFSYRKLASHIMENGKTLLTKPLSHEELKEWARKWGDIILELETGTVGKGGGL
jgi:nitrogenase iron protein NifH